MIADAAARARELADTDGWILVGGIKRVAVRIAAALEEIGPARVSVLDSLDVHSSEAEIAEHARLGASRLRDALDEHRLAEIEEAAGAHGLGVVGAAETGFALEQSSVRDLYVTHRFLEDHASEAEHAVRSALDQDATVEEVSGIAAERLDSHGGMAAGLRFRPAGVETTVAT